MAGRQVTPETSRAINAVLENRMLYVLSCRGSTALSRCERPEFFDSLLGNTKVRLFVGNSRTDRSSPDWEHKLLSSKTI